MKQRNDKISLAPTDLANFLSCRHLTGLDLHAATTGEKRPARYGPMLDALRERGVAHERTYLQQLKDTGQTTSEPVGDENLIAGAERTLAAMRSGVPAIYQAALADDTWSGWADFLSKVETPSNLGAWSYEAIDTKLAQDTKAGTILQLCVYSYLLGKLQGKMPEYMHVVTPKSGGTLESYRINDYAAYFRLLERGIKGFIKDRVEVYPEMVSHCDLCVWWELCERRRRDDDHLCYVAGISKGQIQALTSIGVVKLEQLAELDDVPKPSSGSQEALIRVRDQARAQQRGRQQGRPYHVLREPIDAEHGLALLPEPTPDDIFLDFEGNHFAAGGVQEYLTGYVTKAADGSFDYTPLWATTLDEERQAFEQFIDSAVKTWAKNPKAHIYHFASYEPAALKRLMSNYATREEELDTLLRAAAFVDLLKVVKRSLFASVEGYSIKNLERFFGYERKQDLREASMSRRLLEAALEAGEVYDVLNKHRQIVEDYNREDCESTSRLQDWLEILRSEVIEQGIDITRPLAPDGDVSEAISELDTRLHKLRDDLLIGIPADPDERTPEQQARFKLAHMMEFHRREDKAVWWEKFRLLDLDVEDYADEKRALAGLEFAEVAEEGKASVHRYLVPAQDSDARKGDEVHDDLGVRVGTVHAVDLGAGLIDIKKTMKTGNLHPNNVTFFNRVSAEALQNSLIRFGEAVIKDGFNLGAPHRAAVNLMLRKPPATCEPNHSLKRPDETTVEAACRIGNTLDGDVLGIQGPPGTGKTFTGGEMICELITQGKTVGVTAVSHKVVINLLEGAMKAATDKGVEIKCVHKQSGSYDGKYDIQAKNSYPAIFNGLEAGDINLVGGTAWLWSREDFAQAVDVLIVDEAGQMSLSNVLATSQAGKSLVLLGDPQQLEQPLQSSHPEDSEVSALHHLLDGAETMPNHLGLFLEETWRLHPDITRFTSEVYYGNRLTSRPELKNQEILNSAKFSGSGLRYVPVSHKGSQSRSIEEADVIASIVKQLTNGEARWRDRNGNEDILTEADILIVAPYNAQEAAIAQRLPSMARRIGTVDRFQGQEAPIVIYSMTSSSPEDAPRGMEFLYNPNRFNVATSRAKALCVIVGNPALFEPDCKNPKQMKMANGFCRYVELAETVV